MASRRPIPPPCAEAVDGRHDHSRLDGRCGWCGLRVGAAEARPKPQSFPISALTDAYRYHYDPDWGTDPDAH